MATRSWISFWDSEQTIYVNAHHREVHYRRIADDLRRFVKPGAMVLDYGCGETQAAGRIAEIADQLILSDAAPNVRATLAARYGGNGKIAVMAPTDVATMLDRSLDVIVLHSVAQYMKPDELDALLTLFRRLLKPNGLLVIGAYPKSGRYDLCRASKVDHDKAVEFIPNVPLPDTDPIFGSSGPLLRIWQA